MAEVDSSAEDGVISLHRRLLSGFTICCMPVSTITHPGTADEVFCTVVGRGLTSLSGLGQIHHHAFFLSFFDTPSFCNRILSGRLAIALRVSETSSLSHSASPSPLGRPAAGQGLRHCINGQPTQLSAHTFVSDSGRGIVQGFILPDSSTPDLGQQLTRLVHSLDTASSWL